MIGLNFPNEGTAMTATIWPEEMVKAFSPAYVAPVVGYLCHKDSDVTNNIIEASGGWIASLRWQRTAGHFVSIDFRLMKNFI
jgi:multifunctional beta-oxidation protein